MESDDARLATGTTRAQTQSHTQPPPSSSSSSPRNSENQTYIVDPVPIHKHTHTFILLHGLGSNGYKFGSELLTTGKTSSRGKTLDEIFPYARFVFPTAKWRRSTAFGRKRLTQWFDIARLEDPEYRKEIQLDGLEESVRFIRELIFAEMGLLDGNRNREKSGGEGENKQKKEGGNRKGIPALNIILGGISQGCATSLSVLLSLEFPLGGYVGMSGYLPFQRDILSAATDKDTDPFATANNDDDNNDNPFATSQPSSPSSPSFNTQAQTQNPELDDPALKAFHFERELLSLPPLPNNTAQETAALTPIFLGHGLEDEKKPYKLGEAAAETMKAAGYEVVRWKLYSGLGHWYKVPDEIDDAVEFIVKDVRWDAVGV